MTSAFWVVVIMAIFNYIFTCMAMIMFAKNDPFHFDSFGVAFFLGRGLLGMVPYLQGKKPSASLASPRSSSSDDYFLASSAVPSARGEPPRLLRRSCSPSSAVPSRASSAPLLGGAAPPRGSPPLFLNGS